MNVHSPRARPRPLRQVPRRAGGDRRRPARSEEAALLGLRRFRRGPAPAGGPDPTARRPSRNWISSAARAPPRRSSRRRRRPARRHSRASASPRSSASEHARHAREPVGAAMRRPLPGRLEPPVPLGQPFAARRAMRRSLLGDARAKAGARRLPQDRSASRRWRSAASSVRGRRTAAASVRRLRLRLRERGQRAGQAGAPEVEPLARRVEEPLGPRQRAGEVAEPLAPAAPSRGRARR
jgi:hypothetical protein